MDTTDSRRLEIPSAALIVLALVIAPFVGGEGGLLGASALSIVCLAAVGLLVLSGRAVKSVAVIPSAVFLALLAASAITTANIHATIQQTLFFAGCTAAAIVASAVMTGDKWTVASVLAIVFTGLALGVMAAVEYRNHGGTWRVFGTFVSPGFFGGYLALILPITIAAYLALRSPALVVVAGAALAVEALALFLTGTRMAIASAMLGTLVLIVLALRSRVLGRKQDLVRLGVAVILIAVVALAGRAPTESRVVGQSAVEQAHSGPFRVATWKGTAAIIKAHPILGTGAGTFEYVFPKYRVAGPTRMAHNGYLQLASEAGIPALIAVAVAFLILLSAGLKGTRQHDEQSAPLLTPEGMTIICCGLLGGLSASLLRNVFDSDIYNAGIAFAFWIVAGMAAARAPRLALPAPALGRLTWKITAVVLIVAGMLVQYTFILGESRHQTAEFELQYGRLADAVEGYSAAAAIDPLRGDHWLRLGQIETSGTGHNPGEWQAGIDHIRRAIALEPSRAKNYIVLGRALAAHGDTTAAIEQYMRALDADPHATPAMLAAARLLKGPDALMMYMNVIDEEHKPTETLRGVPEAVSPDYAWAHYCVGQHYMSLGQRDEAAAEFQSAIHRLELRKSYGTYVAAMKEVGMIDPEEEKELDQLLLEAKAALAKTGQ